MMAALHAAFRWSVCGYDSNSGPALMLLTLVTLVLMLVLGTFVYYFESGDFKVGADLGWEE